MLPLKTLYALKYFVLYRFAGGMVIDLVLTTMALCWCREVDWVRTNVKNRLERDEFCCGEVYCLNKDCAQLKRRLVVLTVFIPRCRYRLFL